MVAMCFICGSWCAQAAKPVERACTSGVRDSEEGALSVDDAASLLQLDHEEQLGHQGHSRNERTSFALPPGLHVTSEVSGSDVESRGPEPLAARWRERAGQKRAIVVVRTYAPQAGMLEALFQSLVPIGGEVRVTFLVLPTEADDLGMFRELVHGMTDKFDVEVPGFLKPEVYAQSRKNLVTCKVGPSDEFVRDVCREPYDCNTFHYPNSSRLADYPKICGYENEAHYWLVDRTIDYAIELASGDGHPALLITNGDNLYKNSFLTELMSVREAVVLSEWRKGERKRCTIPEIEVGRVDLGGYIIDLDLLRTSGIRFLGSIPDFQGDVHNVAKMRAFHDNDFWLLWALLIKTPRQHAVVHKCLFNHM